MVDPRMKEALYELAEKKGWQRCLANDIYELVKKRLAKDVYDYTRAVREVVLGWAKHPFDTVEIPIRAAEEFTKDRGHPLMYLPMTYVHAVVEKVCDEVNARFRMMLVDYELPREDLLNVNHVHRMANQMCREYSDFCGVVGRHWQQMRNPPSMFESATTLAVDMRYDLEERYPDIKELFARFTEPFFGGDIGRLMYRNGHFLVDTTGNMYEGGKQDRILQANAKAQFFDNQMMELFHDRWEKNVHVELPSLVRTAIAERWQELLDEEMPVEFMTVM